MGSGVISTEKNIGTLVSRFTLPLKQKIPSPTAKKKVIVISGPTAVGKSRQALAIAQAIGGEIVSADSMQIYRGMDVGTAKPTREEQALVRHHMINIRDVSESFNVADFYKEASQAVKEIFLRGHVPIVVGGTGFYIHALLYGPPGGPAAVPEVREKLEEEMDEKGAQALYDRLKGLDPDYAVTITQRDRHKIIRALEIMTVTNQKVSDFAKAAPTEEHENYNFRCWFLYMSKEALHARIELRCDEMIAKGLLDEVRALEKQGLKNNSSASQAIGYRQCLDYLQSPQSGDDWIRFVAEFKQASKRYAKRQMTWFRREPLFRWYDIEHLPATTVTETIIQDFEQS